MFLPTFPISLRSFARVLAFVLHLSRDADATSSVFHRSGVALGIGPLLVGLRAAVVLLFLSAVRVPNAADSRKHRRAAAPGREAKVMTPKTLDDLVPDTKNANRGTARGRNALGRSLRTLGAGRAIVIDRRGNILAGNKTVAEARALGLRLRVIQTDGRYLVAVQRRDLDLATDARARELSLADNRVGELDLEWDPTVLEQLSREGIDLSPWWTEEEFNALFTTQEKTGRTDENLVLEPGPTSVVRGDLFALNHHRLLCGDATDAVDAQLLLGHRSPPLLMITDPPYGVDYDPGWRHEVDPTQRTAVGRVLNDHRVDWTDAYRLFRGAIVYVWHAGLFAGVVGSHLVAAGFALRSQIIWRKQHFALSRGDYHWLHEPCWYAVRSKQRGVWRGDRTQTTVWDVPNLNPMGGTRSGDNAVTGHGTQKPVRLYEIPILNHTMAKDVIYDPFCGSGTALIAAEKTGRACYAMDLDPKYVQVAVTRWEQFTGRRAVKLPGLKAARRAR